MASLLPDAGELGQDGLYLLGRERGAQYLYLGLEAASNVVPGDSAGEAEAS